MFQKDISQKLPKIIKTLIQISDDNLHFKLNNLCVGIIFLCSNLVSIAFVRIAVRSNYFFKIKYTYSWLYK